MQMEAPLRLMESLGHVVHGSEPDVSLKVPASQRVQDPGGPVSPTTHIVKHWLGSVLPAADVFPGTALLFCKRFIYEHRSCR